jgi:hypothetical protein
LVAIDASGEVGGSNAVLKAYICQQTLLLCLACDASASLRCLLGRRPPFGELDRPFAIQLPSRFLTVGHHVGFFVAHSSLVLFVTKDFKSAMHSLAEDARSGRNNKKRSRWPQARAKKQNLIPKWTNLEAEATVPQLLGELRRPLRCRYSGVRHRSTWPVTGRAGN